MDPSTYTYIWLVCGTVLLIIEWITLGIATIWFSLGAYAAMVAAMLRLSMQAQLGVFLGVSIILFVTTRPLLMRRVHPAKSRNDVAGQVGLVLSDVSRFTPGQVKVSGEIWTAVSEEDSVYGKGTEVRIKRIEGVRLIVGDIGTDAGAPNNN